VATASLPVPTMMSLVTRVVGAAPTGAPITGLLPAAPETGGLVAVASFDTDLAPHPVSVESVNKIESEIKVAFLVRVIIRFQSL
jgi:hypothetical protein